VPVGWILAAAEAVTLSREDKSVGAPRVLVVFYSSEGQTAKIAERIVSVLRERGVLVDVSEVGAAPAPDGYDGIAVGGSIHVAKHHHALVSYLKGHVGTLNSVPSALFQVSLTSANPDAEHTATAHLLVDDLLQSTGFDPDVVGLFAGAVLYTQYGWFKRHVMRAIVKSEGGDLDMSRDYEYTDWTAVERFAEDIDRLVRNTDR
jgi:menaquinone-dependent protoporphyrinogen oxidase